MTLTQQQLNEYQEQGFTCIPDLFNSNEIALMRTELQRLQDIGKLRNVSQPMGMARHRASINKTYKSAHSRARAKFSARSHLHHKSPALLSQISSQPSIIG